MPDLKVNEWLIILATLAGPVLAVQAQKFIERARENRQRRIRLFYSLMATRASRVSAEHVQALNMIDLEFYGRKIFGFRVQFQNEKKVVDAWRIYQDHLNQFDEQNLTLWSEKGGDLFTDLLYQMSITLGFNFDKVLLKRGIYYPRAHSENDLAQISIRDSLVKILNGEESLKMAITKVPVSPEDLERQINVQKALLEQLSGVRPLKVEVVNTK